MKEHFNPDDSAGVDPNDPPLCEDVDKFIHGADASDFSPHFTVWLEALARVRVQEPDAIAVLDHVYMCVCQWGWVVRALFWKLDICAWPRSKQVQQSDSEAWKSNFDVGWDTVAVRHSPLQERNTEGIHAHATAVLRAAPHAGPAFLSMELKWDTLDHIWQTSPKARV